MIAGNKMRMLSLCFILVFQGTALAEGPPESGFLDDYSRLEPANAPWADYVYISDDYYEEMARFQAIIIP